MKRIFEYKDYTDDELFFEEKLNNYGIEIHAGTVANPEGKGNEDAFSIILKDNCLWIGVFDGTTSLKSIPSLNDQTGARFASHRLKELFINVLQKMEVTPKDLLLELNSLLFLESKKIGGALSDTHSLPASMATIVTVDFSNKSLKFAHIGDTYGFVFKSNNSSQLFTDDKNNKFDQEMFSILKEISRDKSITVRQARQDADFKKSLYEMFIRRNNNPNRLGSGLLNGDPHAELYIQEGHLSLQDVAGLIIATDGLEIQGKNIIDEVTRDEIYKIIKREGLRKFINIKKDSEDADPEWNYVRYKHSDDATGVVVWFVDSLP